MKLNIYMKSGNIISVSGVKDWEIKSRGNEVTGLTIQYKRFNVGKELIISSIDLQQIEAVVKIGLFI